MKLKQVVSGLVIVNILGYGPLASAAAQAPQASAAKPVAGKPVAGKKASGTQLLAESKQAIAGILKESKASKGKLDPKNKQQAPFFAGLKELQGALADSEKKLKAKDKKVFESLSKGSEALAKAKTAWPRVGVANAKVDGYLKKLDNSYTALRSHYGAEGARAKKGGPLSAQEKDKLTKIKSSQAEFAKKLGPLHAKAKANGDKGTEAELARLIAQSNKIAAAQLTVDAFLTTMLLLDSLEGEWNAYSYYVGPTYRADWVAVDVWVETSFTTYDSYYWETVDTYTVESWDYWETTMELDVDVEFEVVDVTEADLVATDEYFEASFEYEELSWESYSEEYASAEMEETLFEEESANLDVAAEAWEDEGLEVEAGEELMDAEDAAEVAEAEAEAAEAEAEAADAEADAAEAEAEVDEAEAEADEAEAEADDDAAAEDEEMEAEDEGEEMEDEGEEMEDEGGDDDGGDDGGDEGEDDGGDEEE